MSKIFRTSFGIQTSSSWGRLGGVCAFAFLPLIICLFLMSCSSGSDDIVPADNSQKTYVSFTIALGQQQTVTRAQNIDWTDYDSIPGHDIENVVDVSNLHVVLYDNDGNYVSNVENLAVQQVSNDSTQYLVVGVLGIDTRGLTNNTFNGKVVVYANTPATSILGQTLGSDAVRNLSFDYTPGRALSSIPMYGVKSFTGLVLRPGVQNDLGDIWLLRSLAKVNVSLQDNMTNLGYKLTKVQYTYFNTAGYVVPAGYASVDNTRILNYDSGTALSFHPNTSSPISVDSIDFTGKTLYVPEYDNSSEGVTPATITVTLQAPDGATRKASFDFATYVNGNYSAPMNIVRNHAYQFQVYGNPIRVVLKALPWTVFTHDPLVM